MKLCPRCNTEKPTTEFHKLAKAADGLYSICRQCSAEYGRITCTLYELQLGFGYEWILST